MTFDTDLIAAVRGDHQYVVGLQTLSYTVRATGAVTATVKGVPARPAMAEEGSTSVSKATRRAWILWAATMGSIIPAAGDTITDEAGQSWTVREYDGPTLGTPQIYYRCKCVLQRTNTPSSSSSGA